jgi:hypothetical protein
MLTENVWLLNEIIVQQYYEVNVISKPYYMSIDRIRANSNELFSKYLSVNFMLYDKNV